MAPLALSFVSYDPSPRSVPVTSRIHLDRLAAEFFLMIDGYTCDRKGSASSSGGEGDPGNCDGFPTVLPPSREPHVAPPRDSGQQEVNTTEAFATYHIKFDPNAIQATASLPVAFPSSRSQMRFDSRDRPTGSHGRRKPTE